MRQMLENDEFSNEHQSDPFDADIRTRLMNEIFDKYPSGALMIYKSFRVGVTTSSCIASIDRHEKLLIVETRNSIGDSTIVEEIQKKRPEARIVFVKANRFCIKNVRLSNEYPDLKKLKLRTLPQGCGEECEDFKNCDVMKILRYEDIDIIVITVDKLVALMLSSGIAKKSKKDNEDEEPPITSKILSKLFIAKTVIFDEAHWMQSVMPESITVAIKKDEKFIDVDKYAKYKPVLDDFYISLEINGISWRRENIFVDYRPISDEYMSNEMMARIIHNFAAFLSDKEISEATDAIKAEVNGPGYHEKHFSKMRKNPQYNWKTKRDMASCVSRICNEAVKMIVDGKHKSKYHLNIDDINDLFTMASIVTADIIQINSVQINKIINIKCQLHTGYSSGWLLNSLESLNNLGIRELS